MFSPSFLLFPIPFCSGRKWVSSFMGLSCCCSPVSQNKSALQRACSATKALWPSGPLIYLHRSFLTSFTFLVCKMCISTKINHFGRVLRIAQQPCFSTLSNNIPMHLYKVILLRFALPFSLGKCHLVLYQQSGSSDIFEASAASGTLQTKPIKRQSGTSFVQDETSCSATDTTKQTGAGWAVIPLLSLPSTGVGKSLLWSSLCPGFGHVKHHNHHTAHTERSSAGQGREIYNERLMGQDKDSEITQQSPSQAKQTPPGEISSIYYQSNQSRTMGN